MWWHITPRKLRNMPKNAVPQATGHTNLFRNNSSMKMLEYQLGAWLSIESLA
uniref:Uncharacterized protein n=1 Tax=Fusarium oxysporum (strain Fo5176) TaxID=660025 RepID=A0A0D2X9G6_FUSOF